MSAPVFSIWAEAMVLILIKSVILLTAALTLAWFARRSSAAQRHLYLTITVITLVVLPLLVLAGPIWEIPWLTNPVADRSVAAPAPDPTARPSIDSEQSTRSEELSAAPVETTGRIVTAEDSSSINWPILAGWLWLAGGGVVLLWILGGKLYCAHVLRTSGSMAGAEIEQAARAAAERLGLRVPFQIRQSERIRVPVVTGFLRPALILPPRAQEWPADRREAILTHELAHIQRGDILTQFLAQLACAMYWFNPLVWMAERRLLIERERACDDAVIRHQCKASSYAQFLMDTSEELGERYRPAWSLAGMAEGTDFKDRVLSILDPNARRNSVTSFRTWSVVLVSLLVILPFLTIHPWATARGGDETLAPASINSAQDESGAQEPVEQPDPVTRSKSAENRRGALPPGGDVKSAEYWQEIIARADAKTREEMATAMGEIGGRNVLPALLTLLDDEDARVRRHAAEALAEVGLVDAVEPLCRVLLGDPVPDVRQHAAETLGHLADERAVEPLCQALLNDTAPRVREHAAEALGQLGDERALPSLTEALTDEHPRVSRHAAEAITAIKKGDRFDR
jgi:beta-lactamase regulating signal transducer with metallopeptidase domain